MQITPYRSYPLNVEVGSNGHRSVRAKTTGSVNKVKSAVYCFQNIINGKALVGVTKNLRTRVYRYNTDINSRKTNPFLRDIRKNPEQFTFSILKRLKPKSDLPEEEKFHIKMMQSYELGYNKNRGGGGAFASSKAQDAKENDAVVPTYSTPEKRYPVVRGKNNMLMVDFKESPTKAKRQLIYSIFEEGAIGTTHQVGATTTPFSTRMSKHMHTINNPKATGTNRPLYKRIREKPESFFVGILHEGGNLIEHEKAAIASKQKVFNLNKGGGGF